MFNSLTKMYLFIDCDNIAISVVYQKFINKTIMNL